MLSILFRITKIFAVAFGFYAILFFVFIGFTSFAKWRQDSFEKRFSFLNEKLEQCRKIVDTPQSRPVSQKENAKFSGKVILVCNESNSNDPWPLRRMKNDIDPLMASIPARLVPTTANDVAFVVSLRWGEEAVRTFADGSMAFVEICFLDIFELDSGERVISRSFVGGDPPKSKKKGTITSSNQHIFGSRCDREIVNYLGEIFNPS